MIFNCPECEKKYVLSSSVLGDEGKMVRCVNCAHEWFQLPEQDPYPSSDNDDDDNYDEEEAQDNRLGGYFDDEEDDDDVHSAQEKPLEDIIREISSGNAEDDGNTDEKQLEDSNDIVIPKGVKPRHDEDIDAEKEEKPKKQKKIKQEKPPVEEPLMARLMGFAAAVILFVFIIVGALIGKPAIVSAWPASAAIYNLAGMPVTMQGEGLIIEGLVAELSEDKSQLRLNGNIVNLREEDVFVPSLKASFKLTEIDSQNPWIIEPPQKTIAAEDSLEFSAIYDAPPNDISMVNVTFVSVIE